MIKLNVTNRRDVEVILNALIGHKHDEQVRSNDKTMPEWLRESHARECVETDTLIASLMDQMPSEG